MKRNLMPLIVILHPLQVSPTLFLAVISQRQLGIILNFHMETIEWYDAVISMKAKGAKLEEIFFVPSLNDATQQIKIIVDVKYDADDLNHIVNMISHLTSDQKKDIFTLLTKQLMVL
jgi:hypothetical protein